METEEPPQPADYEKKYVKQWQLRIDQNLTLGRYLTALQTIPNGECVMSLPPVQILPFAKIKNFNRVLQVATNLYSSSEKETDYNNFISHSCDPNCDLLIHPDYTLDLIANRDIVSETPITLDYNHTEWDMIAQGTDFECQCGEVQCKKWIRGKKYQEQSP